MSPTPLPPSLAARAHPWLAFVVVATALVAPPSPAQMSEMERAVQSLKDREPSVDEVQDQALRYFQIHPDRVAGLRTGAALKALVPYAEVSGGGVGAQMFDDTINREFDDVDVWVKRDARGVSGDGRVRLSWNLPRLAFNAEELDVTGLGLMQKDVLTEVTQLFFLRRRLQVELIVYPPREPARRIAHEMRIEELTAMLTGMTGGWFRQELLAREDARRQP